MKKKFKVLTVSVTDPCQDKSKSLNFFYGQKNADTNRFISANNFGIRFFKSQKPERRFLQAMDRAF